MPTIRVHQASKEGKSEVKKDVDLHRQGKSERQRFVHWNPPPGGADGELGSKWKEEVSKHATPRQSERFSVHPVVSGQIPVAALAGSTPGETNLLHSGGPDAALHQFRPTILRKVSKHQKRRVSGPSTSRQHSKL